MYVNLQSAIELSDNIGFKIVSDVVFGMQKGCFMWNIPSAKAQMSLSICAV